MSIGTSRDWHWHTGCISTLRVRKAECDTKPTNIQTSVIMNWYSLPVGRLPRTGSRVPGRSEKERVMLTSRWQSFHPVLNQMQAFQNEMNRLLNRDGADASSWGSFDFPPLNVWESGENLFVEAELPGSEQKDLEIYVTGGNSLTIQGEQAGGGWQGCMASAGASLWAFRPAIDSALPGRSGQGRGKIRERRADAHLEPPRVRQAPQDYGQGRVTTRNDYNSHTTASKETFHG